jgi:hypothetical protein
MMSSGVRLLVFTMFTIGIGASSSAQGDAYNPRPGQRHANFTLPDINTGKAVSLSDFRGKKVLLVQFASW